MSGILNNWKREKSKSYSRARTDPHQQLYFIAFLWQLGWDWKRDPIRSEREQTIQSIWLHDWNSPVNGRVSG